MPGEGVEIDVSTLADRDGAAAATLMPVVESIRAYVLTAERLHADDTTVPMLAKERAKTGRLWTYVREDRRFAGPAPPRAATRPTAAASIPSDISPASPRSCRPIIPA